MLNQKKQAFAKHHREKLKQVQKKLKHEIKKEKKNTIKENRVQFHLQWYEKSMAWDVTLKWLCEE